MCHVLRATCHVPCATCDVLRARVRARPSAAAAGLGAVETRYFNDRQDSLRLDTGPSRAGRRRADGHMYLSEIGPVGPARLQFGLQLAADLDDAAVVLLLHLLEQVLLARQAEGEAAEQRGRGVLAADIGRVERGAVQASFEHDGIALLRQRRGILSLLVLDGGAHGEGATQHEYDVLHRWLLRRATPG